MTASITVHDAVTSHNICLYDIGFIDCYLSVFDSYTGILLVDHSNLT